MRVCVLAVSAMALLAGCGVIGRLSDKQALVSTCIEDGRTESICKCEADALEKNLPPEIFKKIAQAIGREKQDQIEYLSSLPIEELLAFSAVTNDLEMCGNAAATEG